ncbi:MAG: hypothetical protein MI924_17575 [Chloroflexales bacterium]|nr:hypothetical protein [Chloroflexales bacterium]
MSTPIVFLHLYVRWGLPDITDVASENRVITLAGIAIVLTCLIMIWLSVYLQLAPQLIVLEACGPLHRARRSWALVCGAWWRSFSIGLIIGLFYGIAQSIINLTLDALAYLSRQCAGHPTRITRFLLQVGLLPLIPVQHIITTLLYLDLRKQRDAIQAIAPSALGGVSGFCVRRHHQGIRDI